MPPKPLLFLDPFKPQKTYLHLINQCTHSLPQLIQIQASLTTSGLIKSHPFLTSTLIQTLPLTLTPQSLSHSLRILSNYNAHSCFPYNNMLKTLSSSLSPLNALHLFVNMLHPNSPAPNSSSFTFTLKSCARSHSRTLTKAVHALSIVSNFDLSSHVANTALHAYMSCGDIVSSRKLFDGLPVSDTVKWNTMISGYAQNGLPDEALGLFGRMWAEGVVPTDVTVVAVLPCCAQEKSLALGRQIHGFVTKKGFWLEVQVNMGTAMLGMYAKCGCLDFAKQMFDAMRGKDRGAWNALIGGYVSNSYFREAIQSFDDLVLSGLSPDEPTLVSTLSACAHLGALDMGKRLHVYIEERFPRLDAILGTSLIEMYSKCGCIEISWQVFNGMKERDAMAWTSMIGALAAHGHAQGALKLFDSMKNSGYKPDGVTFVGVLNACRHAGLVDEGLRHFRAMKRDYGIKPRVEHYGCMIDLFSRASQLREALELIGSMDVEANPVIWRSLLSACRRNLDVELAEIAVKNLMRMGSGHDGDYVLLSNIYAEKGRWEDAGRVRRLMKEDEIKKKPGFSLVEFDGRYEAEKHFGYGS